MKNTLEEIKNKLHTMQEKFGEIENGNRNNWIWNSEIKIRKTQTDDQWVMGQFQTA